MTAKPVRMCAACGRDQKGKKVWSKHFSKVICYSCHYAGWSFWPDGSVYNRNTGPNEAQAKMWQNGLARQRTT